MDVLLSRDLVVINLSFLATMPRMSVFKLVLGGFLAVLGSVALKPTSFMDNSAAIAHPLLQRAVARREMQPTVAPTAAPVVDQPIDLSWPRARLFLALSAPYPMAHTSDSTSRL